MRKRLKVVGLVDHLSRIVTFYVHIPTGVVTIENVLNGERTSLDDWKKGVKGSWGF